MLLLQCPDSPGSSPTVGAFVAAAGGNIVEADQHSDPAAGLFLQRVEFDVDATRAELAAGVRADRGTVRDAAGSCTTSATRPRVALLASRQGHCLGDLLVRFHLGEIPGEVALVASNHDTNARSGRALRSPVPRGPGPTATATRRSSARRAARRAPRPMSSCSRATCSCCRLARRAVARADDQHPPLVPAVVRRRAPVRAGARTRA